MSTADELEQLRGESDFLRADNEQMLAQHTADMEELERLREQLGRAQALSSADPAAVAELRAENGRLRAQVAELEPIKQRAQAAARYGHDLERLAALEILGEAGGDGRA